MYTTKTYFVEIEDEIQFANRTKVTIQNFDKVMNSLQSNEFIIILVNSNNKIQAGVSRQQYNLLGMTTRGSRHAILLWY